MRDFGDYVDELVPWLPYTALIVVAAFALRRLDDFDTWWHLASGRWIAQHHAVPTTDVLSFTVRNNEWINLQWLYDLLLYAIHVLTGPSGLVVVSAACFIGTFAILTRHLMRYVGPVATTALLIWVAATVNERFLIRPEMASFPLLAAVQLVLADGRDNPKRLRWLVPLMVLWANMHSLFIVGVAAIAAAIGGALLAETQGLPARWRQDSAWPAASRRALLIWGCASMGATLLNPYLLRALLFPLELMRRIDGSNGAYLAIGEFRPPFSGYFPTFALGSYQVMIFTLLGLAGLAGWLSASGRRDTEDPAEELEELEERFDIAPLAFAAALAWLSILARRNIGIFAIGILPFLGSTLGIVLAHRPKVSTQTTRVTALLVLAFALFIGAQAATNGWYARTGETHEFGLGVFKSNFQPRATQFFREQKLPGPTYNDMTTGGYLTWDDPSGKGVYIDGRLEVYDTPFFQAYLNHFTDIESWKREVDARGIQTVMIFHRWEVGHRLLRAVDATGKWLLVYYDETVVIFVRAGPANADVIDAARAAFTKTWLSRTDAALTGPRQAARWQWGIDRATAQIAYGRVLETIGDTKEAVIWFQVAITSGLPPPDEVEARQHAADCLVALGEPAQARVHLVRALELDPASDVTLDMLRRLDQLSGGNPTTLP